MTNDEAMGRVTELMSELVDDGFVVTGELHLLRPITRGLVRVQATTHREPIPRVRLEVIKAGPTTEPIPEEEPLPNPVSPEAAATSVGQETLRSMGYTGNTCTCGGMRLVRRGTCEYCEDCGASNGCS